jgi:ubiquinone/menaquinone biosynthesis C-methylase UbiE
MQRKLNLGCGKDIRSHEDCWLNVDVSPGKNVDFLFDANEEPWVFPDESFDLIYASHVLEHLTNLNGVMKEAHRTLKPNGIFEIKVPYGPRGTFCNDDPNHVREFHPTTLRCYCQGNGQNTSLEDDWGNALFKEESCEVIRIFWQRERLGKFLGKWVEKRYIWPKIGVPVEIHWILRRL